MKNMIMVSVYVLSFLQNQLKPLAAERPRIILFQRNLVLAYRKISSELAEIALKYFYNHNLQL